MTTKDNYTIFGRLNDFYEQILNDIQEPISCFQYTNMQALDGMLKSGCLWATNIRYLNDSSEFDIGHKNIEEYFKSCQNNSKKSKSKIKKIIKDSFSSSQIYNEEIAAYTISFCGVNDLLSQWIIYAKESGVSVEFDFSNDYLLAYGCSNSNMLKPYCLKCIKPYSVHYVSTKSESKVEITEKLIDYLYKAINCKCKINENKELHLQAVTRATATFIKNGEFIHEKESRITLFPTVNVANKQDATPIKHKLTDENIFKPYIEIYFSKLNDSCKLERCNLPIKSITVGPGWNQEMVFQSLISRINNGSYEDTKICDLKKVEYEKEYYNDFLNSDFSAYLKNKAALLNDLNNDFSKFKKNIREEKAFNHYQTLCYFCENKGVIIKKSKIPYLF